MIKFLSDFFEKMDSKGRTQVASTTIICAIAIFVVLVMRI
jgi:hypothetical protein